MENERRKFSRVTFDAPATLVIGTNESMVTTVQDLSLSGVLLDTGSAKSFDPNADYQLHIELTPDIVIVMKLEFAHAEGASAGFHCKHLDLESMSHLRRVVELNIGDPSLLDRDFQALIEEHVNFQQK